MKEKINITKQECMTLLKVNEVVITEGNFEDDMYEQKVEKEAELLFAGNEIDALEYVMGIDCEPSCDGFSEAGWCQYSINPKSGKLVSDYMFFVFGLTGEDMSFLSNVVTEVSCKQEEIIKYLRHIRRYKNWVGSDERKALLCKDEKEFLECVMSLMGEYRLDMIKPEWLHFLKLKELETC